MDATSLSSVDTVYSADAVEFCPGRPGLFACGTYQVVKDEPSVPVPAPPLPSEDAEDADDEDPAGSSTSPDFTRYGRCLLYEVNTEGKQL